MGRANDDAAEFSAYVASHSAELIRLAYLLTGNDRDAEDLVQSALLQTLRHWRRIREREALDAFVRRVMVNERRAWLRRRSSGERPIGAVPETAAHGDDFAAVDDLDSLRDALMQLPQRQRAAVVLRVYDDLSEAETADALGCSVGTVKSLTSRGLARLRLVVDMKERLQ